MSNPSNQVRSALTKEWIFNALMILMQTKNLNNISITEVCTKAGVSRMGFYRNYNIIEDVIVERIDQVFTDFFDQALAGENFDNYYSTLLFFRCFRNEKILVENLVKSNVSYLLLAKCNEYLHKLATRIVVKTYDDSFKENYIAKFYVGGFYCVLIEWALNGMKESDTYMADILYEFCGVTIPKGNAEKIV
ncbi:TetR/AcrR family transcriptional regulator [Paenibacillus sp. FSL k6-2145]|uniref:TetR/AcrR family transcriptional regulator n=1 Tax=Paenibacillus sp. FSL k6-2145 TaxID=2976834 RepID=UPI0030D858AE